MTADDVRRHLVAIACAISAGIHGALFPEHLAEGAGAAGGFAAAALALAACAVALTRGAAGPFAIASAALLLTGLLVSYALATTAGLPFLHPEAEAVDGLALGTKAVEALGLAAALDLLRRVRRLAAPALLPRERTTWIRLAATARSRSLSPPS